MSGKTSTSSSSVSIPPEVLARYNSANAAGQFASGLTYGTNPDGSQNSNDVTGMKPFQNYGGEFVAPVNNVEQSGINQISNYYQNQAQNYVPGAENDVGNSYAAASGYTQPAMDNLQNGANAANGLFNGSINTGQAGVAQGSGLLNSGVATMNQAANQASGMYGSADSNYLSAANQGQQGLAEAKPWIQGAYGSAMPSMGQASGLLSSATGQGQQFANQAQGFMGGSTGAVNPNQIDQTEINRYMSPYLNDVVGAQQGLLNQQNAQQQAALKGNAISSGAFGSDRAGIASANLSQQQNLSNAQIISGLLNQGYSQALGTAQQQQGVNLSAQQANRQAQQFGEQASASLGQQQYNQALGASNAYQQLGQNMFNMNVNQGNALAGLGQQAYNMQAGVAQGESGLGNSLGSLGAQQAGVQTGAGSALNSMYAGLAGQQQGAAQGLYNVGQGLASTQLAAGQQTFNQGQQAGANWLNLGLQSQNAGLAGSQAAIAAGQVGQQTQQAQDTALYNQFMQQQGYPFQVAQFMANLAEGTGSLSGSTTTTTQPAPWWSDERLKHDKSRIGKMDDGTPIYRFRYKDDPSGQPYIGPMAQDVEEKHPEAVGLLHGRKTLDYDKLPAGRPERDVGGIVNNSFSPYKPGMGSTSYVPSATLPVGQLKIAQPSTQKQDSPLKGLIQTGTSAVGLGKDLKSGYDWLNQKAAGGLVRGYDDGGDIDVEPYGDGSDDGYMSGPMKGMKIPRRLQTANNQGNNSNSSNPLSDISSAVSTAKNIYGLGSGLADLLPALALKGGGLVRGYDDGGDVIPAPDTGDDTMVKKPSNAEAYRDYLVSKGWSQPSASGAIGNAYHESMGLQPNIVGDNGHSRGMFQFNDQGEGAPYKAWAESNKRNADDPYSQLDFVDSRVRANPKLWDQLQAEKDPRNAAQLFMSGYERPAAATAALSNRQNYADLINSGGELPSFSGRDRPARGAVEASGQGLPPSAQGLMPAQSQQDSSSSGLMGNIGNLLSGNGWKGDGDNRMLLSVLQGLGTMASSDSRYLGASLLQGLGGGAKAYSDQTKLQSEIAKNSLGLAGQIFKQLPNGNFYNSMSGEELSPPQHAAQLLKLPGLATFAGAAGSTGVSAPAVPGATQATAPTTAPTQPSAGTGQPSRDALRQAVMQEIPADYHNMQANVFANADEQTNPVLLGRQITQLRQQQDQLNYGLQHRGENPAAREALATINQQITDRRNQMNDILTGKRPVTTTDANGSTVYDQGANKYIQNFNNQIEANKKTATEIEPAAQKSLYEKRNQFYSEDAPMLEQTLDAATRMASSTDTNKASGMQSEAIGYLRSIPWVRDNMADSMARLQAAVETQQKGAIKEAFQDVQKGLQRAPSAALRAAMQAVANPEMSPGARYNLITQSKANLYRDYDYFGGWDPSGKTTVGDYNKQFQTDPSHAITGDYTKKAIASTPYFAGMQEGEKNQLGYYRNDDGTVTDTRIGANVRNAESTARKGSSAPAGQVVKMPVAAQNPGGPPTVNSPAEARKLPSGTIFRTPDGRLKRVP